MKDDSRCKDHILTHLLAAPPRFDKAARLWYTDGSKSLQ
jgi:hypothetical protein